ncbi:N-acetylmuramic acid 6-phosphate etherase [Palleronia marisminoris]|uniref:N-acetylmuramic acid 6-phosphate etherase n=1 Tax=Palleronia marisminoris TaxID=315423 RepID=A0A1Y5S7P8_9RHOB|nr:N-acetylmuramic acid 6-phosphate etherase [Palleronia marisminoris]SFG62958.1 N-acetylmuramic acid 6-phosphate etherase [Palleronia marisminoris]SLN32043.1 N-acetylmuramic acid 6-phosphate etherase [Palleronia marisminoris]
MSAASQDLRNLVSEGRNPRTTEIDRLPAADIVALMNSEDARVAEAVRTELPAIARAVDRIVAAFENCGRLIYVGAGTSGRLGVLDASECVPTFSVPPGMVVGLIAGGDHALRLSVEDAEDDAEQGAEDLAALDSTDRDVIVGIAVSGKTPYVIGALDHARRIGAGTVALSCNPGSIIAKLADIAISPVVGAEVLTGSTRLKSGTAQKMVLNMLSTASMIRIGKTYGNLMVDLSVSNRKLAERAVDIVMEVTGCPEDEARALLGASGGNVKLAILMQMSSLDIGAARAVLETEDGVLRRAIERAGSNPA